MQRAPESQPAEQKRDATPNPLDQLLKLDLTAGEVNYILSALGFRPFGEVSALINKIKQQGDAQFVAPPAPEAQAA